jgi:hypothetical protein
MKRWITIALVMLGASSLLTAHAAKHPPPDEDADDGLLRVEPSLLQELYVAPGVSLAHYQRVMLDPIEIEFRRGWRQQHPDLGDRDLEIFRQLLITRLHDAFVSELARGGYGVAEAPAPDVLQVRMRITDAEFQAPEIGEDKTTHANSDGKLTLRLHGYDAPTGSLVARARDYMEDPRHSVADHVDRATALKNAQLMFEQWAREFRSALDVARVKAGQEAAQK